MLTTWARKVYHQLLRQKINAGPFSVQGHVVVFESDDRGCQRIHSQKEKDYLDSYPGFQPHDRFEDNDCLETKQDFDALSKLLKSFSDSQGHHPVFTLNYVLNNLVYVPFNASGERQFAFTYEPLEQTYLRSNVPFVWNDPVYSAPDSVFAFSLHAFAHLNEARFLMDIEANKNGAKDFYSHGAVASLDPSNSFCYMDEMGGGANDVTSSLSRLEKASKQFQSVFHQKSICFTPSCGVLDPASLSSLAAMDFLAIKITDSFYRSFDGKAFRKHPIKSRQKLTDASSCRFLVRNCAFEPIFSRDKALELCLQDIAYAFKHHKPAIISTHRMNYVAGFDNEAYQNRLHLLSELLGKIMERYPDVQFMSTDELVLRYFK
jgi:hypothetical protein